VHNLLFADDQVVITRGVEVTNYIGKHLEEEYEKWELTINYGVECRCSKKQPRKTITNAYFC
jgi:hypothetical protein